MIALRRDIGAWGLNPSEVTYIVSTEVYYDLLEDPTFQSMDKVNDRATLLTGQIGSIANSPVLVSAEMDAKAAGAVGAVAFNTGNFIVGNQRGLRIDTQDLVETQQKVLVASLRTGMTQLTTNLGQAVSAFRWVA
jgi:N4-gp56 family major capsid protein